MNFAAEREEICRVGRSLFERGRVHATAGNISVRVADGYLITPTDACLGFLRAEQIAHTDLDGEPRDDARPSKSLTLHRSIYAADRAAQCVIHTHSTPLVALALEGVWRADAILPPITPYFVMKVGHVPLLAYARPGDPVVADRVAAAIEHAERLGVPIRAVMLSRLGPNVWAGTPAAAMARLEELEETARLWLQADPKPVPLSPGQIDELRRRFGARW